MTTNNTRLRAGKSREDSHIFALVPSIYAATRTQGQHILPKEPVA